MCSTLSVYVLRDRSTASLKHALTIHGVQTAITLWTWTEQNPYGRNTWTNVDSSGNCYTSSGKLLYHVTYGTPEFYKGRVSGNEQKNQSDFAYMQVEVHVQMKAGLCKYFGINGYEWSNTYKSDNFRTDNERAGD